MICGRRYPEREFVQGGGKPCSLFLNWNEMQAVVHDPTRVHHGKPRHRLVVLLANPAIADDPIAI